MSKPNVVIVKFHVQPRAKRNQISGVLDDGTFRIRLTAPPVEGKANRALIEYLADVLGISRSEIAIISGEKSREKLVGFNKIEKEFVIERLSRMIKSSNS